MESPRPGAVHPQTERENRKEGRRGKREAKGRRGEQGLPSGGQGIPAARGLTPAGGLDTAAQSATEPPEDLKLLLPCGRAVGGVLCS